MPLTLDRGLLGQKTAPLPPHLVPLRTGNVTNPQQPRIFYGNLRALPLGCQVQIFPKRVPKFWRHRDLLLGPQTLSSIGTYEFRIDLVDFEGNRQFAKYESFALGSEAEKYKLVLGAFVEGTAGECGTGRWSVGRGGRLLVSLLCPLGDCGW